MRELFLIVTLLLPTTLRAQDVARPVPPEVLWKTPMVMIQVPLFTCPPRILPTPKFVFCMEVPNPYYVGMATLGGTL